MVYNKCVPNFILKVVVHKVLLWLNLWPSQKVCNWLTIRTTFTNPLYSWTQSSLNSIRRTLLKQIWSNNVTEMFCFSLGENAPILCLFCVFVCVLFKILTWECELVMGRWRTPQGMWCFIINKNDWWLWWGTSECLMIQYAAPSILTVQGVAAPSQNKKCL